jgi:hypothetical protein
MTSFNSNELSQGVEGNSNSKLLEGSFYDARIEVSQNHKSLDANQLKNRGRKGQRKPIPSRIDYNFFNYCSTCELKYPKLVLRCKECKQKVRTRPWHRSRAVDRRRI